jgi:hypothetical protein
MFWKLLLVILTAVVTAAMLLAIRQQRLETAHRASIVHRRLATQETALWELQHRIASRCAPEELRAVLESLDLRWEPIPDEPVARAADWVAGACDEAPSVEPWSGG